jgi:hypothetical protein
MSKGGWPHALYVGRLTIYDDSDLATVVWQMISDSLDVQRFTYPTVYCEGRTTSEPPAKRQIQ